jgi:hypothetical protein
MARGWLAAGSTSRTAAQAGKARFGSSRMSPCSIDSSSRWYVNGKLYKQVLAPGGVPKEAERAVTTVLSAPYNIPLYELRWPIQFESKGTGQTNDVIVLVDHWSLWERV